MTTTTPNPKSPAYDAVLSELNSHFNKAALRYQFFKSPECRKPESITGDAISNQKGQLASPRIPVPVRSGHSSIEEFDLKITKLRNELKRSHESLVFHSRRNLNDVGSESSTTGSSAGSGTGRVRSFSTIDPIPYSNVVKVVGPLPRNLVSTITRGTNTELSLINLFRTSYVSPKDPVWRKSSSYEYEYEPPTPTGSDQTLQDQECDNITPIAKQPLVPHKPNQKNNVTKLNSNQAQELEWTKLIHKAKYFFKPGKDGGHILQSPISFSKVQESQLDLEPAIKSLRNIQKSKSMFNLSTPISSQKSNTLTPSYNGSGGGGDHTLKSNDERARSMEFLLEDSDKNAHLRPPENTLMLRQDRQLSEHELRIQRSLNKLNVPDWYKKYGASHTTGGDAKSPGSRSTNTQKEFGSGTGLAGGWAGLSSTKTSSLTSLQYAGRYRSRTPTSTSSRLRTTTVSTGGRSSAGDSMMSPSSTASASPSPYFERSSFTYGMPYALTRFASSRMSHGASPCSLSPSPSPVGGVGTSTSTPTASGPSSRHHSFSKQPYLGWRSQEKLNNKPLYRSPSERLAADLLSHKQKAEPASGSASEKSSVINVEISPRQSATASDLSLNNSEESTIRKLNRVRSSIKAVSNAIVDYVNETKPLDDGINGRTSPRRGLVWLESSFVGTKPIDSPGTPSGLDVVIPTTRKLITSPASQASGDNGEQDPARKALFRYGEDKEKQMEERSSVSSVSSPTMDDILDSLLALKRPNPKKVRSHGSSQLNKGSDYNTTTKADVQMSTINDDAVNMNIVTSPSTINPLPLSPPHTTFTTFITSSITSMSASYKSPSKTYATGTPSVISKIESSFLHNPYATVTFEPEPIKPISPISDWHFRMNQPVLDSVTTSYFPDPNEFCVFSSTTTQVITSENDPFTSIVNHKEPELPSTNAYEYGTSNKENDKSGFGDFDFTSSSLFSNLPDNNMIGAHKEQPDEFVIDTTNPEPLLTKWNESESYIKSTNEGNTYLFDDEVVDSFSSLSQEKYTSNKFIPSALSSAIANPNVTGVAATNDSPAPSSPAKHRRVSFDLDVEDKEDKSSSRSKKDDSIGGTIHCRNSKCSKTATGLEARREFKTCHNCNAYYCSRECRRAHWEKHKKVCMQSRVGALCKQIINHVKEDSDIVTHLSMIAKRGVLAKGRGCVKLFFSSPDRAERFLTGGFPELPEPWYIPSGDILPEEMGAQIFTELNDQCQTYNIETRFVLYVTLCVVNEVPTSGAVKWEREMIARSAKLRLNLPRSFEEQLHNQTLTHVLPEEAVSPPYSGYFDPAPPFPAEEFLPPAPGEGETLILKSVPIPSTRQLSASDLRKMREVSFANIQKHLNERGVELRRTYPDIYSKLCNYVENNELFIPTTIYPRNSKTGKQFVCIIMPESIDTPPYDHSQPTETINISPINRDDYT